MCSYDGRSEFRRWTVSFLFYEFQKNLSVTLRNAIGLSINGFDFPVNQKNSEKLSKLDNSPSSPSPDSSLQEIVSIHQQKIAVYYEESAFELLIICNTLYTKASSIYKEWANEQESETINQISSDLESLWKNCWRPILQAMARYLTLNVFILRVYSIFKKNLDSLAIVGKKFERRLWIVSG